MIRIDLLRDLASIPEASAPGAPPPGQGPLKRAAYALLALLVLGAVGLWLAKPEWMDVQKVTSFWKRHDAAREDSVHALRLRAKASRLVDARQAGVIEWLATLEGLTADPHQAGAVAFTKATFTAAGDFALEGLAPSAEALSALQEAMVLVPGLDLKQSRATEIPGRAPVSFAFSFAGHIAPDSLATDTLAAPLANRVGARAALAAQLDTLVAAGAGLGITFATPRAGETGRQGALNLDTWRLKGLIAPPGPVNEADSGQVTATTPSSPWGTLRALWERERHRGSPFAIQRITLATQDSQNVVFLDILALSP